MKREHIINRSDDDLLGLILNRLEQANRHIKIGERMEAPFASVWRGKLVRHEEMPQEIYRLDFQPPHYQRPSVMVEAKSTKILFSELENLELNSIGDKWLYPYQVIVPHRQWMQKHQPGDTIMVFDDQFDASPVTLTEQHFKDHEYLIFRFGLSD